MLNPVTVTGAKGVEAVITGVPVGEVDQVIALPVAGVLAVKVVVVEPQTFSVPVTVGAVGTGTTVTVVAPVETQPVVGLVTVTLYGVVAVGVATGLIIAALLNEAEGVQA